MTSLSRIAGFARKCAAGLRKLGADSAGNTLLLYGVALVPLMGCVGLASDASQWVLWKRQLRAAADGGALAGAQAIGLHQDADRAARRALSYNASRAYEIVSVQTPPTSGAFAGDPSVVKVILKTQQSLPFTSMFLSSPPVVQVSATARAYSTVPNCVIALEPTTSTGVTVTGSAALTMSCGMASNSVGTQALLADGQTVDVPALSAAGGIVAGTSVPATTYLSPNSGVSADPFAAVPNPSVAAMCAGAPSVSVKSMTNMTIGPGCYKSLKSLGGLYLTPGTYYIDGGDVTVGSQSLIQGYGVTLVFTSSTSPFDGTRVGSFNANGSSYVRLTAPDTGIYAGIVMFQDRRTVMSNQTMMFVTGNSGGGYSSLIQGAIYAPATEVTFSGNSGIATDCMQIVGRRVTFTGNTTVRNECPAGGGAKAFGGAGGVKLVG